MKSTSAELPSDDRFNKQKKSWVEDLSEKCDIEQ